MQARRSFSIFAALMMCVACSKSTSSVSTSNAPTFSPAAGTYSSDQTIILEAPAGAQIWYAIRPSTSFKPYTGAIPVEGDGTTVTIEAYSQMGGGTDLYAQRSFGVSATYTIDYAEFAAPAPSGVVAFSPAGGTYATDQEVTLRTSDANAIIYYTTDGSDPTTASTTYTLPIAVQGQNAQTTIKAMSAVPGGGASATTEATYKIVYSATSGVVASPSAGTYTSDQNVVLTSASPGATIYYTIDGSAPSTGSTPYTGPIAVGGNGTDVTIHAVAFSAHMTASTTTSAHYVIAYNVAALPTFSPAAGVLTANTNITITSATSGAAIHYTTDGTAPTTSSPTYSAPILVAGNGNTLTIKALATASGMLPSAIASAAYTVAYPTVANVVISPNGGEFNAIQTVTLSTTTSGATIYFTTDGSNPSLSSTTYNTPFTFAGGNINAFAVYPGLRNSAMTSATFAVNFHVATSGSDTTGDGSASSPYATPAKAFTRVTAATYGRANVLIQQGTYSVSAALQTPSGAMPVGVYGGYDGNWTRNPNLFTTTLQDATSGSGILSLGTSAPSAVDGLTLELTTASNYAITLQSGPHLVTNNTITGPGDHGGMLQCIYVPTGAPIIMFNKLILGDGLQNAIFGIYLSSSGRPIIYSNVIDVSSATAGSSGIVFLRNNSPVIANNTVRFRGTTTNNIGIQQGNGPATLSAAYIENNIVFDSDSGNSSVCVSMIDASNLPTSLKNNNLFGCATLYEVGASAYNTPAAIDGLSYASANINFDLLTGTNTYFINETSDFHLQAGGSSAPFIGMKQGGLSQGEAVLLENVSTDLDGTPRTASGGIGWSMGAYEQDN